jgi:hypothetical protein
MHNGVLAQDRLHRLKEKKQQLLSMPARDANRAMSQQVLRPGPVSAVSCGEPEPFPWHTCGS